MNNCVNTFFKIVLRIRTVQSGQSGSLEHASKQTSPAPQQHGCVGLRPPGPDPPRSLHTGLLGLSVISLRFCTGRARGVRRVHAAEDLRGRLNPGGREIMSNAFNFDLAKVG